MIGDEHVAVLDGAAFAAVDRADAADEMTIDG